MLLGRGPKSWSDVDNAVTVRFFSPRVAFPRARRKPEQGPAKTAIRSEATRLAQSLVADEPASPQTAAVASTAGGEERLYLNTPAGTRACGIGNVGITGQAPAAIADALLDRFRIYTVAIDMVPVKGVRVTPHLYTTTGELDAFVKAMRDLAARA
jgi:hypothetical protein